VDNVADGTENFFVFSRAEQRTYRMPFSQGENSKLILHRQRIVWCLALITIGVWHSSPLVFTNNTTWDGQHHIGWRWEEWFIMAIMMYIVRH